MKRKNHVARPPEMLRFWVSILLLFATIPASADDDIPVEIEGRAHVGLEVERYKHGEPKYDAEIELKSKRKLGTRGVLSLRADDQSAIFLQDIYLNKKLENQDYEIDGGRFKKKLGLEWEKGERKRLTIKRTYIYQKLEEFAYVGRESILKFSKDGKDDEWSYSLAAGYAESTDSDIHMHVSMPIGDTDSHVGNWALLQWDKIDVKRQLVWANIFSLWKHKGAFRYEVEYFCGVDPFESEFQRAFGDGKDVTYSGYKFQTAYGFDLGDHEIIQPFLHGSYFVHNTKKPNYNTIEIMAGLNYLLEDIEFALNFSVIGTNSDIQQGERVYDDSSVNAQASIYF